MKKRIFSVLTAIALCLSLVPSAFADSGEIRESKNGQDTVGEKTYAYPTQTNYDPFKVTNAVEVSQYFTWYKDLDNGKWTKDGPAIHPQDDNKDGVYEYISGGSCGSYGHYIIYKDMVFDAAPEYFLMHASTDSSVSGAKIKVSLIDSNSNETVLATVDVPQNGWTKFDAGTYAKIENTVEPGTYDVKLTFINNGNLKDFVFGKQTKDAYKKIEALKYDSKHEGVTENTNENCLGSAAYNNWVSFNAVDFGEKGAAYLKFYTSMLYGKRNFKITNGYGGEVLLDTVAIETKIENSWVSHTAVIPLDNAKFKGIKDICIQYVHTDGTDNLYGIEFVEMKNASEAQAIHTGDFVIDKYRADFGIGGYNKISLDNLTVAEGVEAPGVKLLSADGNVLDTISVTAEKADYYLTGAKDLTGVSEFSFECTEGVSFTGFSFGTEYDAFPDKTEIKTAYVGTDSEANQAVANTAATALAKDTKTVTGEFIDLTGVTAFGLAEKEYELNKADYDIVFVEAGANCESVVDALAGTDTYVIVIGEDASAAKYGVVSATQENLAAALNNEASFKTADLKCLDPYNEIIARDNFGEGTDATVSDNVALNMTGHRAVFKDVNFANGVSSFTVKAGLGTGYTGKIFVYADSVADANKIGEFDIDAQGWTTWVEHTVNCDKVIYGIHDIWFSSSGNGNLYSFKAAEAESIKASETLTADMAGVKSFNDKLYIKAGESVTYWVDFGDSKKAYTAVAEACGKEEGTLTVKIGGTALTGTVGTDFAKVYTGGSAIAIGNTAVEISADKDIALNSVKFLSASIDIGSDALNISNYAAVSGVRVNPTFFGGFSDGVEYVRWNNVDFGEEQALRTVTFSYGTTHEYQNTVMTLRLDSPTGEVIAKAAAKYADGINWEAPVTITVPMIKGVTGQHSVYLKVEQGDYTNTAKGKDGQETLAANIFNIEFKKVEDKTYDVAYDKATYYKKDATSYEALAYDATLTFIGASDVTSVIFAEAIYDSNNKLVDVALSNIAVEQNKLNTASLSVKHNKELPAGTYKVKSFVWNGTGFAPLNGEAVVLDTITVAE